MSGDDGQLVPPLAILTGTDCNRAFVSNEMALVEWFTYFMCILDKNGCRYNVNGHTCVHCSNTATMRLAGELARRETMHFQREHGEQVRRLL